MMETYFNTPPSLPDAQSIFFLNAFVPLLSCLVYLGRFDFIFYPAGLWTKLTSQLVLARSLAALFFCGGNKEAAKALLFVRALFLARLPRTPTRLARARLVLHMIYIDRSSSVIHVSRIQVRKL